MRQAVLLVMKFQLEEVVAMQTEPEAAGTLHMKAGHTLQRAAQARSQMEHRRCSWARMGSPAVVCSYCSRLERMEKVQHCEPG